MIRKYKIVYTISLCLSFAAAALITRNFLFAILAGTVHANVSDSSTSLNYFAKVVIFFSGLACGYIAIKNLKNITILWLIPAFFPILFALSVITNYFSHGIFLPLVEKATNSPVTWGTKNFVKALKDPTTSRHLTSVDSSLVTDNFYSKWQNPLSGQFFHLSNDGQLMELSGISNSEISIFHLLINKLFYPEASLYVRFNDVLINHTPYEEVNTLLFDDKTRHFGYVAKRAGKGFVVFDGREGKYYDLIVATAAGGVKNNSFIKMSHDGTKLAYWVKDSGRISLVLRTHNSELEFPIRDPGSLGEIRFSDSNDRIYFESSERFLHVASKMIISFDPTATIEKKEIPPSITANKETNGGKQFFIVNGVPQKKYDTVSDFKIIPKDNGYYYAVRDGDIPYYVINGKETYERSTKLTFSPDGKKYVMRVEDPRTKQIITVLTNEKGDETYFSNAEGSQIDYYFSTDSHHLVYTVVRFVPEGVQSFLVINGTVKEDYFYVPFKGISFSPDSKYVYYLGLETKSSNNRRKLHWISVPFSDYE